MKNIRILRTIRNHPLVDLLFTIRGNPRVCILIEPLWGIPFNLIAPFATVYMYALGVNDLQIGIMLSLAMSVQLVFSFLGGVIADKIGRKNTTILGDFLGWAVPCIIWGISQNFWFFLIAMIMNSFEQINQTAWTCLLIEDADKKQVVNIYTWITLAGLLAVFFAPISGVLIRGMDLVPVVRVLYFFFSATMLFKCIITYKFTTETAQGYIRKEETKEQSIGKLLLGYKELIPKVMKNRATIQTLGIMVILHITFMIGNNFFAIFVSDTLGVPKSNLAFFPMVRAVVMIIFMFVIQHRFNNSKIKVPMGWGFVLYIAAQVILVVSPKGQLLTIVIYLFLDAVAFALVVPRKDSMVVMNVEVKERARIVALLTALTIGFSMPFGYIAGLLSSIDRRLPFLLSIALFIIAIIITMFVKEKPFGETEELTVS